MSRMDREVNISTVFRSRHGPGFGWFANVLGRGNELVHQTAWYATEGEASEAAEAWAKENGHVTIPF